MMLDAGTSAAQTSYRRATLDRDGQLRLTTATGLTVRPPKDSDQVGFDQVAISPDRTTVGWAALYPNCCTTYPIPLKLVLLTRGGAQTFVGNGLSIWRWAFWRDARQIAFRQAPVHGSAPAHYELRDIRSGRLIDAFDMQSDSAKPTRMPRWARVVAAAPSR
jgi:hypothetical protein